MALISCPDCGASVSSRSAACIKCGCPIAQSNVSDTAAQHITKHSSATDDLEDEDFDDDLEDEEVDDVDDDDDDDDDDFLDDEVDDDLDEDLEDDDSGDDYTSDKNNEVSRRKKFVRHQEPVTQVRQFRTFDEIRIAGGLSTLTAKEIEWFRLNRADRNQHQSSASSIGTGGVQFVTAHDMNDDGMADVFLHHNSEQIRRAIEPLQDAVESFREAVVIPDDDTQWRSLKKWGWLYTIGAFFIGFVFGICMDSSPEGLDSITLGLICGGCIAVFPLFFTIIAQSDD